MICDGKPGGQPPVEACTSRFGVLSYAAIEAGNAPRPNRLPVELPMPRRELGSVYTPPAIARRMVSACLDRCLAERQPALPMRKMPLRVLDPACGDGAFLLEVFEELCRRLDGPATGAITAEDDSFRGDAAARRLQIVRDHIFGVDLDPPAVAALRSRVLDRIAAPDDLTDEATAVVETNIHCGDSLTGPGFDAGSRNGDRETRFDPLAAPPGQTERAVDWQRAFPAAAAAGGFDVIVGNPPYLRERDAKTLFDRLAATDLGRRWREARMDLWHYFVHRSLDLLRPGGILEFVVNSYWMSSRGAGRLIERLQRETRIEEIALLHNARIFKAVAGRHMTFRLQKRTGPVSETRPADPNGDEACRIIELIGVPGRRQRDRSPVPEAALRDYSVPLAVLFHNGRVVVAPVDPAQNVFHERTVLGERFETRQGMAENPPAINRRLLLQHPGPYAIGEGVFVLRPEEVERLNLLPAEKALLRPYYETSSVGRFRLADEPTHAVLYLTRRTAPSLDNLPNVAAHLACFRPILERRRETREGKCAWWHLHWPRDERIFRHPRILSVQMGERPQFVYAERPAYVGFSVNVILAAAQPCFTLDVLTGILNSSLAQRWFDRHAKRRGVNLEINAHLLRQFPLPGRDEEFELRIGELVRQRQESIGPEAAVIEAAIEDFVARLYQRGAPAGS